MTVAAIAATATAATAAAAERVNVLFVCVGNSGRSVMAERLFRRAVGDRHAARSAGADSRETSVEPAVLEALREVGVDASDHVPRCLNDADVAWADVVVATCDVACPVVEGKRYERWDLPDPYGRPLDEVRTIRDELEARVRALIGELG